MTSVWASTQVSDTEQYVQTVAPLAEDPAVQSAIAQDVTRAVLEYIDVETLTTEMLQTLAQENVPRGSPRRSRRSQCPSATASSFTRTQVDRIVASPQFAVVWERVNRVAHEQVVTLLEGTRVGRSARRGTPSRSTSDR